MPDPAPYLANGVLGLRPAPGCEDGHCCLNGFATRDPERGGERAPAVPFPLAWDLRLGGWSLARGDGELAVIDHAWRWDRGELRRELRWRIGQSDVRIELRRWCDRVLPNCSWLTLHLHGRSGSRLQLLVGAGARHAEGRATHVDDGTYAGRDIVDGCLRWESPDGAAACGQAWRVAGMSGGAFVQGGGLVAARRYDLQLTAEPVALEAVAATVVDLHHPVPERQAVRLCWLAAERGCERMAREHAAAWDELLQARPLIDTDDAEWQARSDAAVGWLHQSVHAASPCMTGLFGLSLGTDYHYFNHHRFWDLDTYVTPPLLLSDPDAARAMIDWRVAQQQTARANAAMNGYRGLQYPWESAQRHGAEVTPVDYAHIIHEQHVTLAVARACHLGAALLDDGDQLRAAAWPVLRGVAEWCVSRVAAGGLRDTMGICEGIVSDRNTFVQLAMRRALDWAGEAARSLGREPDPAWARTAEALAVAPDAHGRLPTSAQRDADAADDVTEVLAAFYPYGHRDDPAVERATVDHYLRVGERACGMPMLPPFYAVLAARLGERERAAELLEAGLGQYVFGRDRLFDEFGASHTATKPRVGPYLAHAGALVMNLLYGWPGLEPDLGPVAGFAARSAALPAGWRAIRVERLWLRGRPYRLEAEHGSPARLEPLERPAPRALVGAGA